MSIERTHDVAIIGLGAMGSAAAFELARRGLDVVGFDRFTPPHTMGSSHGDSRIIREAYFEHPLYVPMVQRAFELWRELERRTGSSLLSPTGGLMIGAPDSVLVEGARRSAQQHGLAHELLSAAEIRARFPVLQPEADMVGVWEPRAGVLAPEACVAAQLDQARRCGATLHFDEPVDRWQPDGGDVSVFTALRHCRARQLIISAGAWAASLLPGLRLPFRVERQVLHWLAPTADAAAFGPTRCPVHLWQIDGTRFFYGLPDMGAGVKLAFHHGGETSTVDAVRREVTSRDVDELRAAVRRFVPAADGHRLASSVCLYTNTADEHFWIDRCPDQPQVLVASPCSGHGFKFAPVIGEIVADLVQGKPAHFDLGLFRWR
ncbi:MAG TPA: N-methyl-L-tryptophan oxidase [Ideonella sp.]|uniref:N-methyl-L-tryptophan oxidase n=1 Tax=Ideonella sp. TaxID=1929293 RepID=UPI002E34FCDE|nr:N-methyl-L-tryptophan oxidase [Ideonella sp.]HEX5688037.1 N-methyl-L-tryptophan oxidase [Ideonella sp.]